MEIACVIDERLAISARPGCGGGPRPGRADPADPVAAAERTEAAVRVLETLGAGVESSRSGEAFFAIDGLHGLHGGSRGGVLASAQRALEEGWRIGSGRTRLAAFLAAGQWPRPAPVAALRLRLDASKHDADELIESFEQLGI